MCGGGARWLGPLTLLALCWLAGGEGTDWGRGRGRPGRLARGQGPCTPAHPGVCSRTSAACEAWSG